MSFVLDESFARELLVRPLSAFSTDGHRNFNSLGGDIVFHPGGGALEFKLGYRWRALFYDDQVDLNTDDHKLQFMALARDIGLEISAEELQAVAGGRTSDAGDGK